MASFFKRKQKEKESHIASSPEREPIKRSMTKRNVFFLLLNIISIVLYSCYTLFVTYRMADEKSFLGKFILGMLVIYAASFLILFILSIGNQKKLKSRLKNYKSAIKFLKYLVRLINFVLSISTAISAIVNTGRADVSAIGYAILSFIITIILILVEIAAIIVRKNIPLIKRNFLEIRDPDGYNDKKNSGEDDD